MERGEADVATALQEDSPDEMRKLAWLKDSCHGVQQLHSKGMVWTDLKAENFALFKKGRTLTVVKCIDLDCCVMNGQCLVGYTSKCMPPELARHLQGKSAEEKQLAAQTFQANKSFDMWGLGLYIWRMQAEEEFHDAFYKYDQTGTRVFDEDQCITYLSDRDLQGKIDARIATIKKPKVRSVLEALLKVDPSARTACNDLMGHSLFDSSADATKGVATTLKKIDGKVASVQSMVQKALTTVLAMANDELQYPSTFIVLPVPSEAGGKRSLAGWFKTPDRWCNDTYVLNYSFVSPIHIDAIPLSPHRYMIVFICGRTGRRVKYGKDDGLVFTVPREGKATAIVKGVQKASAFWDDYGVVMKMSGALLCTLVKASTSLDLREILPLDYLSDMAAGAMGALQFVQGYGESMEGIMDGAGIQHSTWSSFKPADGVDAIVQAGSDADREQMRTVAGKSYRVFGEFLEKNGFKAQLLLDNGMWKEPEGKTFVWQMRKSEGGGGGERGGSPAPAPAPVPALASTPEAIDAAADDPGVGEGDLQHAPHTAAPEHGVTVRGRPRGEDAEPIPPADLVGKRLVVFSEPASASSGIMSCAMERDPTFAEETAAAPSVASKGTVASFQRAWFFGIGPSKHTVVFDKCPSSPLQGKADVLLRRHGNNGLAFEILGSRAGDDD
jgi:hypothetical protein